MKIVNVFIGKEMQNRFIEEMTQKKSQLALCTLSGNRQDDLGNIGHTVMYNGTLVVISAYTIL